MRTALLGLVSLVTMYLVGRWYFDRAPSSPPSFPTTRDATVYTDQRPDDQPAAPDTLATSRVAPRRPSITSPVPSPPRTPDEVLETAMLEHREAMMMLRERFLYE